MPVRSRLRRGIAAVPAVFAALAVAVATVSVAAADDYAVADLAADAVPVKAADFGDPSCGMLPPSIEKDEDGWVFNLPNSKWRFASVTATFTTADGGTDTRSGTPTKPPHGTASSKYYVIAPAGWTLTGASAEVEPKVERPGSAPSAFELLHTCVGTPDEPGPDPSSETPTSSPSESPSQPEPSTTASPSASASDDGGGLPVTGRSLTLPLLSGLILVAAGLGIVIAARRRRTSVVEPGND